MDFFSDDSDNELYEAGIFDTVAILDAGGGINKRRKLAKDVQRAQRDKDLGLAAYFETKAENVGLDSKKIELENRKLELNCNKLELENAKLELENVKLEVEIRQLQQNMNC
ncbi:unnamed protein product [Leptidea sinapis]|uniref:SAM-dependent MTase TRM10-type domain-containing protein n=1 Tax=Leptidea sinapis TaxID=189913 RepID=A0A5E4QEL1_9NEOP|nr:unnamed protein product [Leptidea sinapis]